MKKAIIYLFSATGNTALVANLYKKYLTSYDTQIHKIKMENGEFLPSPNPNDFDLIGFAYPIHAFNAPEVFFKFCKKLPPVDNKTSFIAKSSGEGLSLNNYSSQKFIRLLEKRGYNFISERHYVMPHNIIFRHNPRMVKIEYNYAKSYAKLSCQQIQAGQIENVHQPRIKAWFLPLLRIEWWYAKVQGPLMKVDKKKCINCNRCVNNCPLGNIKVINGRYRFGRNCALCSACFFSCPKNAIKIGILNAVKLNGSYNVERTANDESLNCEGILESLRGVQKASFYYYYKRLDELFKENNIPPVLGGAPEKTSLNDKDKKE